MRTQTYEVSGRSARDIRSALNRQGPYSSFDGRRYDAITLWNLRWSFRYDRSGGTCALESASLDFEVVITLPELDDVDQIPDAVLQQWDAYFVALEEHENGHVAIQREHVLALEDTFAAFDGVWPTCRDLSAELNAAGEATIAAMNAADRRYDADTDHGRLQGAVFP